MYTPVQLKEQKAAEKEQITIDKWQQRQTISLKMLNKV